MLRLYIFLTLSGPSGGGKSSCISMLERFYEPQSGSVLVDGRPLSQYDHTYLHTRMSLVGQEPVLYARSVAENISCNLEGTTQESIEHAAKLANAHSFITAMTDGYDTQTGEKGKNSMKIWLCHETVNNWNLLIACRCTAIRRSETACCDCSCFDS